MDKLKKINYNFFHWGPFLYRTVITKEEVDQVKKLCSKQNKDVRETLAGLLEHEHKIDHKKLFPVIFSYLDSYAKAYFDYRSEPLGDKIELKSAWVNYMTKFESNPIHIHDEDLSFVLFLQIPKELLEEYNKTPGNAKPGCINFTTSLESKKDFLTQHRFFPKVGELYIFPASLPHYVNHFKSDGERISVSGNVKITRNIKDGVNIGGLIHG